jgi:hypothetical protein
MVKTRSLEKKREDMMLSPEQMDKNEWYGGWREKCVNVEIFFGEVGLGGTSKFYA